MGKIVEIFYCAYNGYRPAVNQFEAGKEYATRSICNHDCIFRFTVTKRTAKSIWISERGNAPVRRSIYTYQGEECIKPYGTYSMAPILGANDLNAA